MKHSKIEKNNYTSSNKELTKETNSCSKSSEVGISSKMFSIPSLQNHFTMFSSQTAICIKINFK